MDYQRVEFMIMHNGNSQVIKVTILIKFQITNPVRVLIDPGCCSLNELFAAKLNTVLSVKCTAEVAKDFASYWGFLALCMPVYQRIYALKAGDVALPTFQSVHSKNSISFQFSEMAGQLYPAEEEEELSSVKLPQIYLTINYKRSFRVLFFYDYDYNRVLIADAGLQTNIIPFA